MQIVRVFLTTNLISIFLGKNQHTKFVFFFLEGGSSYTEKKTLSTTRNCALTDYLITPKGIYLLRIRCYSVTLAFTRNFSSRINIPVKEGVNSCNDTSFIIMVVIAKNCSWNYTLLSPAFSPNICSRHPLRFPLRTKNRSSSSRRTTNRWVMYMCRSIQ